jgi:hypothetical protein
MGNEPEQPFSSQSQNHVVELCNEVAHDLSRLVPGIVDAIRHEVPGYDAVDRAEQEGSVTEQYQGLLMGLSERRPPNSVEVGQARSLGQRRAEEGLPVQAMISAYHIGYREMWNVILRRASTAAGLRNSELLALVDVVWTWVERASAAAADAYEVATRLEDAARTTLILRLLNGIYGGVAQYSDLGQTARALGFDPTEAFRVIVSPSESWAPSQLAELRHDLARAPRGAFIHAESRGTSLVIISQGTSAEELVVAILRQSLDLPIGVGLERVGLAGAADSAVDAEEALLYARGLRESRVVWFERDWLAITLLHREDRLAPLLTPDREISSLHEDAAVAVRGFIDNGFSFSAAGRALHLHSNTVRYRLDRWQQLTGWDVKTEQGLLRSIAALELARRHSPRP